MLLKTVAASTLACALSLPVFSATADLIKFPGQANSTNGYYVLDGTVGTFRGKSFRNWQDRLYFSVIGPNGIHINEGCSPSITSNECSKQFSLGHGNRGVWRACAYVEGPVDLYDCSGYYMKTFEVQSAPVLNSPVANGSMQTYSNISLGVSGSLDQNYSHFGKQGYYTPQFHWVLPGGELRQGSNINTSFSEPGNYTIYVKAFDGVHYSDQKSLTISIAPSSDYISTPYLNVEYGRGNRTSSTFFVNVYPGQYGSASATEIEYSTNGYSWIATGHTLTISCGNSASVRARVSNGVRWSGYATQTVYANACGTVTQPR